jgi:hypothetical protein
MLTWSSAPEATPLVTVQVPAAGEHGERPPSKTCTPLRAQAMRVFPQLVSTVFMDAVVSMMMAMFIGVARAPTTAAVEVAVKVIWPTPKTSEKKVGMVACSMTWTALALLGAMQATPMFLMVVRHSNLG